jgi:hypothetical protein
MGEVGKQRLVVGWVAPKLGGVGGLGAIDRRKLRQLRIDYRGIETEKYPIRVDSCREILVAAIPLLYFVTSISPETRWGMAVVLNTAASAVAKVLSVPVTAQLPPIFPPLSPTMF